MNQPQNGEEQDDAVVGRAFVWSASAIALTAIVVGGFFYWKSLQKPPKVEITTQVAPPERRKLPTVEIPEMPFVDITKSAGLRFQHYSGATGEKLLPETMGGGCAFLDYDNDGDQDILFVNSTQWPWDDQPLDPVPTQKLFRNDGECRFTDVTDEVGLNVAFYGQGVAIGDYDSDGDLDIFFSAVGPNRLFRNEGGKFVDVSEEVGVGGDKVEWSTSCGFLDYDNDGDLDLFVANYVKWDREFDKAQPFTLTGRERAYGRPQNFPGTFPYLYRNDQGKFTEVGKSAGLHVTNPARKDVAVAKSLGVTFVDADRDGFMDIIVANDTVQNFLFHNLRDGTFEEVAILHNVAFDQQGNARGAMGIDSARFRNGEHLAVVIGNFSNEMTAFYVTRGDSMDFVDEANATGIGPQSRLELKFGTLFLDIDLDGRPDIIGANGHLENEISKVQLSQQYAQPPHFFWNCGPESPTEFVAVPKAKSGVDFYQRMVGRGSAAADIDGDGDLDLLFAAVNSAPRLLRNDQKLGHHWLRVDARGPHACRSAIGAQIEVELDSEKMNAQVMPTRSYLSQSELPVTFGLGKKDSIKQVTVTWPGGQRKVILAPQVDQVLTVTPDS
ncbi:CRTAC1 family protein [Schlesneria sp.]|uniref:CRTAC1 family protein n=1 Tax=Schlesneria sp. TaxID=2762018 RepID=UPI002F25E25C